MTIESIKYAGAKQALFEKISNLLWEARHNLEQARETDAGIYKQFTVKIAGAKSAIAEAEEFYFELVKMQKMAKDRTTVTTK